MPGGRGPPMPASRCKIIKVGTTVCFSPRRTIPVQSAINRQLLQGGQSTNSTRTDVLRSSRFLRVQRARITSHGFAALTLRTAVQQYVTTLPISVPKPTTDRSKHKENVCIEQQPASHGHTTNTESGAPRGAVPELL